MPLMTETAVQGEFLVVLETGSIKPRTMDARQFQLHPSTAWQVGCVQKWRSLFGTRVCEPLHRRNTSRIHILYMLQHEGDPEVAFDWINC